MKKVILVLAVLAPAVTSAQVAQQPTPSYRSINSGSGVGSRGAGDMPSGQAGPVLDKPLTATEVYRSTQVLADGTRVDHTDTSLFYRDDRGRMRTEGQGAIAIFDPVAGLSYLLRASSKTYSQGAIANPNAVTWVSAAGTEASVRSSAARQAPGDPAAAMAQRRFGLPASEPVTETLAPRTVNGIMANGSRVTITIPKGALGNDRDMKVVSERWYSDELKVLVKSVNSDPRYGVTTYDLTQVVQSPPDPSLFHVPADFRLQPSH